MEFMSGQIKIVSAELRACAKTFGTSVRDIKPL